ncbi:helix-turn-helix domain-containing protein [Leuconostoc suionicum]|uniref:helix-turn-helix domain-containing protein n=1 Tax=Leuconostoc suionicum TaxID=1511761 RepID=UPI0024AE7E75|nr:helix-turn-helix transcriptional regulator [Leuconostoc suionicum]MDI6522241.1 helix-turn-helix transcriptional regulator [Leuconostoc suionicum]
MKNKLKEIRKLKNKTLKEVSDYFGIAVSTLNGYENNYRQPKMDMLTKLADYYGVSITSLMAIDEKDISDTTLLIPIDDDSKINFKPNNNDTKYATIAVNQILEWLDSEKNLLYADTRTKDNKPRKKELELLKEMNKTFSNMRDDFQAGLDRNLVETETEYIAGLNAYITTFNIFENIIGLDNNIQNSLLKITNELHQNKKSL